MDLQILNLDEPIINQKKKGRPPKIVILEEIFLDDITEPKKKERKINPNAIYRDVEKIKAQRKIINKKTFENRGCIIANIKAYKKRYNLTYPIRSDYEGKTRDELLEVLGNIKQVVMKAKIILIEHQLTAIKAKVKATNEASK